MTIRLCVIENHHHHHPHDPFNDNDNQWLLPNRGMKWGDVWKVRRATSCKTTSQKCLYRSGSIVKCNISLRTLIASLNLHNQSRLMYTGTRYYWIDSLNQMKLQRPFSISCKIRYIQLTYHTPTCTESISSIYLPPYIVFFGFRYAIAFKWNNKHG